MKLLKSFDGCSDGHLCWSSWVFRGLMPNIVELYDHPSDFVTTLVQSKPISDCFQLLPTLIPCKLNFPSKPQKLVNSSTTSRNRAGEVFQTFKKLFLLLATRCLMLKTSSEQSWIKLNEMEAHNEIRK